MNRKDEPEIIGHIGDLKITGYSDARDRALRKREEVLENFGKYSGRNKKELETIMRRYSWMLDPAAPYYYARYIESIKNNREPVFCSAWDFNGCLSGNRDGYDEKHTFNPELNDVIRTEIERLGSFVIISALTAEQMVWHMAKDEQRALNQGENRMAENIIVSAENGRSWLIPKNKNGRTTLIEYRLLLSEKHQKALAHLKQIMEALSEKFRSENLIAFVNKDKFSKCTMEAANNGREWYEHTIQKILLPYLVKNDACWDGKHEIFTLDGVEFAVSPTAETWEMEITEGADKIGKRFAMEILHNTITDVLSEAKYYGFFKMITGGDSVKWGGSDAGLTDPNAATIPFVIQSSERPVSESMRVIEEAINVKRKYWPEYITDGGTRLAGPGVAPARFMETIADTVPHLKIPLKMFTELLVERLTRIYGFTEYKNYDLGTIQAVLYKFPDSLTHEQQHKFLKAGYDLPIPAGDQEKVNAFIKEIRHKIGLG